MREPEVNVPMAELKDNGLYKLLSRNLSIGIWNTSTKSFVGIRTKFSMRFLDEEFHWDTGAPYGTAHAREFVEMCPFQVTNLPFYELSEDERKKLFDYLQSKEEVK